MNRKSILILMVVTIFAATASAQDYVTHGASPDLYLTHKVAAKETWYSIGRIYNLSPKEIAAYNKLSVDKSLEIAQPLKIPLSAANFSQDDSKGAGEVFVPVYHVVGDKEWMYRISVNHNKVPVEKLEKWNGITRDDAKSGTKLIVGYLKVKEANASLATKNSSTPDTAPVATPKSEAPKPVASPVASPKPDAQNPAIEEKKSEPVVESKSSKASKTGGYFKSLYSESGKSSSGVSGIFKSTSGWNDGKYYALMNNVTVGTIIKINYLQTNKSVFAKVLGELPDMKESNGLALRISDAAANELGASTNKFSVDIKY